MDIDEEESAVPATSNPPTSAPHSIITSESKLVQTPRSQTSETAETTTITHKTKIQYSSTPLSSLSNSTTSVSYSPLGVALSIMDNQDSSVQSLLPDSRGIFHYHRPKVPGRVNDRTSIQALVRALIRRRVASRSATLQCTSEAREHAFDRVIQRLGMARPILSRQLDTALSSLQKNTVCGAKPRLLLQQQRPRDIESSLSIREIEPDTDMASDSQKPQADDDDQWVSDPEDAEKDELTSDLFDIVNRIKARAAERRKTSGGVSKALGITGKSRKKTSLAAAYARYKTDDEAVRRTVSEMGQGDSDTVLQMIRAGIAVDLADNVGRTPLHIACSMGNAEIIRLLLHMGADVNATDKLGNTPLMLAATNARTDIVFSLLEAGADPRVGRGIKSALSMVRARLRLLRTQIRHQRAVEQISDERGYGEFSPARERRRQTAAVANECVDIIRLLRHYTQMQSRQGPANDSNPAYDAYKAITDDSEQHILSEHSSSQLDELSTQLMSLGLTNASNPQQDTQAKANSKGKMPESAGTDLGSKEEDQIEELLDKFALMLGVEDKAN
ncbi:hypothetical protein IWW36_001556 [Coemansia brasiliensis]|uniref:Ankyrin n=1 Tax=Coemansia brasiliensis TaxID=2650707 RepID=A0A9W8M1E0_9FUNG|nr:hypothetical protein IWW36_001556 [Coemansia brasiliensis]